MLNVLINGALWGVIILIIVIIVYLVYSSSQSDGKGNKAENADQSGRRSNDSKYLEDEDQRRE